MTIPGMLELGAPVNGDECWGQNGTEIRHFITEFAETYHKATGRRSLLITDILWYEKCTDYWHQFPFEMDVALITNDNYPPNDHDLEIIYQMSWVMWETGQRYKYGGLSQMYRWRYSSLRDYTQKG